MEFLYALGDIMMDEWWTALGGDEKVFYGIAIIASLIMFIQLVLTMIGGAFDAPDGDFEIWPVHFGWRQAACAWQVN